jgi:hypothetical protein
MLSRAAAATLLLVTEPLRCADEFLLLAQAAQALHAKMKGKLTHVASLPLFL